MIALFVRVPIFLSINKCCHDKHLVTSSEWTLQLCYYNLCQGSIEMSRHWLIRNVQRLKDKLMSHPNDDVALNICYFSYL